MGLDRIGHAGVQHFCVFLSASVELGGNEHRAAELYTGGGRPMKPFISADSKSTWIFVLCCLLHGCALLKLFSTIKGCFCLYNVGNLHDTCAFKSVHFVTFKRPLERAV